MTAQLCACVVGQPGERKPGREGFSIVPELALLIGRADAGGQVVHLKRTLWSVANMLGRIYPYLLRNVRIERPDQVWSTDITYVPLAQGFMYLAAILDWYSRHVLAWRLSNTLDGSFGLEMLEEALSRGRPEVFNTDQGVQFTAQAWTGRLESAGVAVSMDGKGRCLDNVFVERRWRTVKTEPTKTTYRHTRCRAGYNRRRGCVPLGLARTGPLLREVPHARRICTMSDRPAAAPPRA